VDGPDGLHGQTVLDDGASARDNSQGLQPSVLGGTLTMTRYIRWLRSPLAFACLFFTLMCDIVRFVWLCLRPSPALAAENLFLV